MFNCKFLYHYFAYLCAAAISDVHDGPLFEQDKNIPVISHWISQFKLSALGCPNSVSLAGRGLYDEMRFGDSANNR